MAPNSWSMITLVKGAVRRHATCTNQSKVTKEVYSARSMPPNMSWYSRAWLKFCEALQALSHLLPLTSRICYQTYNTVADARGDLFRP